eukprot:GHVN01012200.1.p1 GENE.GHVN01012200.1~~GHVN01012200.1.p1  ORF type:complete len:682 (+),score=171.94 GHVN01012200.1:230-2047(+)
MDDEAINSLNSSDSLTHTQSNIGGDSTDDNLVSAVSNGERREREARHLSEVARRQERYDTLRELREENERKMRLKQIIRRDRLPMPRTDFKVSLWGILKDCIGRDLSRIALPVNFNEPTSFTQRLVEDFQYSSLLKQAATKTASVERLALVSLFAITPFASAEGRTYKPFNPLLGETFEHRHNGFRFLCEQVGHHPPTTAYHMSDDDGDFSAYGHVMVKNKFTGKTIEVWTPGTIHISLPKSAEKDHYTVCRPRMLVHNVIWGKLWVELVGVVVVTNHATGDFSVIEYLKKGWMTSNVHEVRAAVFDKWSRPRFRFGGVWSKEIWSEDCIVPALPPSPSSPDLTPISPPPRPNDSSQHYLSGSSQSRKEDLLCDARSPPVKGTSSPNVSNSSSRSKKKTSSPRHSVAKEHHQSPLTSSRSPPPSTHSKKSPQSVPITAPEGRDGENGRPLYKKMNPRDFDVQWDSIRTRPETRRVVWRPDPRPPHSAEYYSFGYPTFELNETTPEYDIEQGSFMPPTDSRFRPDQRALEWGDCEKAMVEKGRLEEKQRSAARTRPGGEADHVPIWFERTCDVITHEPTWTYISPGYWEAKESDDVTAFDHCPDIF